MNFQLAGRYRIEAVNVHTGESRELAPWFDNLILDSGLNIMGTQSPLGTCMVGSGTATPANSQTSLSTQVAVTSTELNFSHGVEIASGYAWERHTYRFAAGVAAGNLSEVGVGWSSTLCFSRALIVDGGGTPTTITVLSDEYLDVTYELRTYWPASDVTSSVTISGSSYDTIVRPAIVGSWMPMIRLAGHNMAALPTGSGAIAAYTGGTPATLGAITTEPGGTVQAAVSGSGVAGAYVNNSKQRTYFLLMDPFGGIVNPVSGLIVATALGHFKMSFNPSLPKTDLNNITINFTVAWARRVL